MSLKNKGQAILHMQENHQMAKAAPASAKAAKAPASAKAAKAPASAPVPEIVETLAEPETLPELALLAEETVYEELLGAAQKFDPKFAAPHADEQEKAFYKRLCAVIPELGDADYEQLSHKASTWLDAAIEAINDAKKVGALPGFAERTTTAAPPKKAVPKASARLPVGTAAKAPAIDPKTGKKAIPAGLAAFQAKRAADRAAGVIPTKAPKEKKPKSTEPREAGRVQLIRNYVIANPDATAKDVLKHLDTRGFGDAKMSTINLNITSTKSMMAYLAANGYLASASKK
jgi:hypothetical protein